jgi:hypothetical protein
MRRPLSRPGSGFALGSLACATCCVGLVIFPAAASGYTISNELIDGCHERLTSSALRDVRRELATAAPLSTSDDEQALVEDLPFTPDDDMRDLGAVTLLLAVRDGDLKGHAADDLSALAEVHGDPAGQQDHCLRGPGHKEPGGSKAAVEACRSFIRERTLAALAGLDARGAPDPGNRSALTTHLSIRGSVAAPLPTFYLAAGAAIHAIQDSFTHAYRTLDGTRITVALTWYAVVNGDHDEARDGPAHAGALDRCDDADQLRTQRRILATLATADFLRATLDPTKNHAQKVAAVDALLDKYLGYASGCTFENNWCDAPENQYKDPACGCRMGHCGAGGGASLLALLILWAIAQRAVRRTFTRWGAGTVAVLLSRDAQGQTTVPPTTASDAVPPPPVLVPVAQPGPKDLSRVAFGAYAGIAGSVDKPAAAGALGARLRATSSWTMGLDLEWNPWIAFNGTTVRKGAVNVYATGMLRFPLAYERFNLRLGFSVGTSYLLTDLYGAPSGSLGLYLGVSPLSVEWKVSRLLYLIINPMHFAMPVPRLHDLPLLYPQYRTSVGLEFYAP